MKMVRRTDAMRYIRKVCGIKGDLLVGSPRKGPRAVPKETVRKIRLSREACEAIIRRIR